MDSRKEIEACLQDILEEAGFKKSKLSWHRSSNSTVAVLNVQKSAWSDSYYINCAVSLLGLSPNLKPPEHKCHLRARIDSLIDSESEYDLAAILDFENRSLSPEARRRQLKALVYNIALPWLDALSTEERVHEYIASQPTGLMVTVSARNYLQARGLR